MNESLIIMMLQGIANAISAGWVLREYYKLYFLPKKRSIISTIAWILYFLWQCLLITTALQIEWYTSLALSIGIIMFISITAYKGRVNQKIVFSATLCAIWSLAEFLVGKIFFIFNIDRYTSMVGGSALSKLLMFLLIIILHKISGFKANRTVKLKHSIFLGLIPMGSIIVMSNIFYLTEKLYTTMNIYQEIFSVIIMLGINLVIIKIYFELSEQMELEQVNAVYNQQLKLYNQYMEEKENDFVKTRNLKHDIKQHFIYLLNTMEHNKLEDGIVYLKRLMEGDFSTRMVAKSGNFAVDAIVNYKVTIATKKNIEMKISLDIPTHVEIEDTDICIILGNLIDNAIEAAGEMPVGSRNICLYMRYDCGNLYIQVNNSHNNQLRITKKGRLLTTKEDEHNHGMGLLSVKKALEKYDGVLKTSFDDQEFTAMILAYSGEL